ncbi:siderophore ABC transporter substrate-binding protein [Citrobacter amalonaticus]
MAEMDIIMTEKNYVSHEKSNDNHLLNNVREKMMMKNVKEFIGFLLIILTLCLPSVANSEVIKVTHAQGDTSINVPPQKVAILDIASLDTLWALGVKIAGVPTTPLPPYLSQYNSSEYKKVGSLFEPDYEALSALEPDLIIVGGRSSDKYKNVALIAPTIDLTPDFRNRVQSDIDHTRLLGSIFHKEEQASALIIKLSKSISDLKKVAEKSGNGLLIMTSGGRISALGSGSWFSTIYTDFGVKPVTNDLDNGPHGQVISYEFLLKNDPDWLFVIDRDAAIGQSGESAKQLLDNDLIHQTKAWKNNHIIYLDPVSWYIIGDGITSLQKMVDEINNAYTMKRNVK